MCEQHQLYGKAYELAGSALMGWMTSGLDQTAAAARVIEISEQVPAPIRATVGIDAALIKRMVREKSDEELDEIRAELFGLNKPIKNSNSLENLLTELKKENHNLSEKKLPYMS